MSNRLIKSFMLFFLCFFPVNTKSMELAAGFVGLTAAAITWLCTHKEEDNQNKQFCVITRDGKKTVVPGGILRHCQRLKMDFYTKKRRRFPCKKQELKTFIEAASNPTKINCKDLSTIMKVSEKCGAYLLYAFCVSSSLPGDTDALVFDFFKQLINPVLSTNTFLHRMITMTKPIITELQEEPWVSVLIKNKDYYVEQDREIYGTTCAYYHKNKILNCKGEPVYFFERKNAPYMGYNAIHLFKKENIILYFEHQKDGKKSNCMTLYDIDQKESMKLLGLCPDISPDENYIIALSEDHKCVIVYDISNFADIKTQYIKWGDTFWGVLMFCPNSKQFLADFSDRETNEDKVERLGLWKVSDLAWTGLEKTEMAPCKLVIPVHDDYIQHEQFSANGRYMYCYYKDALRNKIYTIIDFETFENVTLPGGRDLASYRIMKDTNLLIRENPFEIFDINDLSQPLYVDQNGLGYGFKYRALQYLYYKKNDDVSCLLKYDKENASIQVHLDNIDGYVRDIREDGSILAVRNKKGYLLTTEKVFFYDSKGSKVELFDAAKSDIEICNVEFGGVSDKAYLCSYRSKKSDICFDLCTAERAKFYDQSTCAQYALLQIIWADRHGNQNDALYVPNDPLATAVWNSFDSDQKTFLQDTLKLTIEDGVKK